MNKTNPVTEVIISAETTALVEEHIRRLLEVMGFLDAKVACAYRAGSSFRSNQPYLYISINSLESGRLLIGVHGAHLSALQHLVRATIRRHLAAPLRVTVDVNGYVASRERTLLHLAEEAARKVGRSGRAITLPPMAASERHIIHNILSSRQDISTESLGDEPNRRIVVRPVFI